MNWNDIPLFLAIAEEGTLAGAARRLGVNHSTVFRRLNALEAGLDVRLFDRLPEGYRLTRGGEAMLEPVRRAEVAVYEARRQVSGREVTLTGSVRLTAPANLAQAYLPALLGEFGARYPAIRVELSVSDRDLDLSRREADIALRATSTPPEHLIGRRVCELPWYAVAAPAYLERRGRPAGEAELAAHCLIGADDDFVRLRVFRWLREHVPREAIRWTSNDLNTMAALARQGLGIALLPQDQRTDGIERLFPVCPEATGQLWLLTHPDLRQTARVRALAQHLHTGLRRVTELRPEQ